MPSPHLPNAAPGLYESIRADVLEGHPSAEAFATLRFHGMLQGLAILLKTSSPTPSSSPPSPPPRNAPVRCDSKLVRLLANFVLHTHSELTHVC